MPISTEQLEQLRRVKAKHEGDLLEKANVVGVGIGFRRRRGQRTTEPAIVVSVTRKVPRSQLEAKDIVPGELDGVPVDIQAVGELRAFSAGIE